MLKRVVSSSKATESRGFMKNGKIMKLDLWEVWVLSLECGHKAKRATAAFITPPTKIKCKECS